MFYFVLVNAVFADDITTEITLILQCIYCLTLVHVVAQSTFQYVCIELKYVHVTCPMCNASLT